MSFIKRYKRIIVALLCLVLMPLLFIKAKGDFGKKMDKEGLSALQSAIAEDVELCYAVEGRYPPSVEYLTEHYGLTYDENQYKVFYDSFSSTIAPDVTVIALTDDGE